MIRPGPITLTLNPAQFRGHVQNAINRGLVGAASVLVEAIKDSMSRTGGPASAPGTPPAVQGNTLRKGIARTSPQNGEIIVHTSNVRYAYVQEYGGPITPRTKQYLAVPLGPEARRIRRDAKDTLLNSSRDLFVYKSKRGNLLLMERHGKRQRATPRFVLKRSVTLPERPFMRPAIRNRFVQMLMAKAFAEKSMRSFQRLVKD